MNTKACNKCGDIYPYTAEYFRRNKSCKSGLEKICKGCKNAYNRQYRKDNADKIHEYNTSGKMKEMQRRHREKYPEYYKEYYQKNRERILQRTGEYRQKNSEWYRDYNKRYYQENKDRIAKRAHEYYLSKYKEKAKINAGKWDKANPDKKRIVTNRRRARKKLLDFDYNIKAWGKCKMFFENKCAYCGEESKLQQDHFIAIAKGGEYTRNNILPACAKCNISKKDRDFFEWYPKQKFYDVYRERKVLKYLNYKGQHQQLMLMI